MIHLKSLDHSYADCIDCAINCNSSIYFKLVYILSSFTNDKQFYVMYNFLKFSIEKRKQPVIPGVHFFVTSLFWCNSSVHFCSVANLCGILFSIQINCIFILS